MPALNTKYISKVHFYLTIIIVHSLFQCNGIIPLGPISSQCAYWLDTFRRLVSHQNLLKALSNLDIVLFPWCFISFTGVIQLFLSVSQSGSTYTFVSKYISYSELYFHIVLDIYMYAKYLVFLNIYFTLLNTLNKSQLNCIKWCFFLLIL